MTNKHTPGDPGNHDSFRWGGTDWDRDRRRFTNEGRDGFFLARVGDRLKGDTWVASLDGGDGTTFDVFQDRGPDTSTAPDNPGPVLLLLTPTDDFDPTALTLDQVAELHRYTEKWLADNAPVPVAPEESLAALVEQLELF